MVLYRCLNNSEIVNMVHNHEKSGSLKITGENTFNYNNEPYKHFFIYSDHAEFLKDMYDGYLLIGQYNIPRELIDQYGFGFYYGVKTKRNNKLLHQNIPIPEVIMKEKDFDNSFLVDVADENNTIFQRKIMREYHKQADADYSFVEEFFNYDGRGEHGPATDLNYSYGEVYYELIYHLINKYKVESIYDISKYIQCENLKEIIKDFYKENKEYFHEQTKQYIKSRPKIVYR